MSTNRSAEGKKHLIVRQHIEEKIRSGELKPGDRLPTEQQLVEQLGVSKSPVRHALTELASDGWIYSIRGSGRYAKRLETANSVEIFAMLYSDQRGIEKDLIHGMRRAVGQHTLEDVHLVLKKPGKNTAELIRALTTLQTSSHGGVVVIPILSTDRAENRELQAHMRGLTGPRFQLVQLDRTVPDYEGHYVMTDHRLGAYKMTEYLLSMGHRRIGVVYEHPENTSIGLRRQGVRDALVAGGLEPNDALVDIERRVAEISGKVGEIIRGVERTDATVLFCLESELARETYLALEREGVRVPDDVSLCSFDDHAFAGIEENFLTAVVQKLEQLGLFAVEIILNSVDHYSPSPIRMTLEPDLVVRNSVAAVE